MAELAGLYDRLEDLLGRPVDLATPNMIRPFMRETVEKGAVNELILAALILR